MTPTSADTKASKAVKAVKDLEQRVTDLEVVINHLYATQPHLMPPVEPENAPATAAVAGDEEAKQP